MIRYIKDLSRIIGLTFLLLLFTSCKEIKHIEITIKTPTLTMPNIIDSKITEAYQFLKLATTLFTTKYNETHKDVEVEFNVVCFPITEEDKYITDCFDTEDAADILYEGYFNMSTYIHTGRVVPLDDIITPSVRSDIYTYAWEISKRSGRTYMMPFSALQNILAYNKVFFEEAGLTKYTESSGIQNWSLAEWEEILTKLRSSMPKTSYPFMMFARNEQGDTHILTLLRIFGCPIFDEKNLFCINQESGRKALKYVKDSFNKGFYPTACSQLEITDNSTLFSNDQLAIYVINSALINNFPNKDLGFVNFPCDTNKTGLATAFITGFEVFDNKDNTKLSICKEFIKELYETPALMDFSCYALPLSRRVVEKYKENIFMLEEFSKNREAVWNHTQNNPAWRGVRSVFYKNMQNLFDGRRTEEEVAADIDRVCNAELLKGMKESILHK